MRNKTFRCSKLLIFFKKIRFFPPKQYWWKKFFLKIFIFYHPFESINFQPAGLMKIALIVTSLLYIRSKKERKQNIMEIAIFSQGSVHHASRGQDTFGLPNISSHQNHGFIEIWCENLKRLNQILGNLKPHKCVC